MMIRIRHLLRVMVGKVDLTLYIGTRCILCRDLERGVGIGVMLIGILYAMFFIDSIIVSSYPDFWDGCVLKIMGI
jgi:hypothetical protein